MALKTLGLPITPSTILALMVYLLGKRGLPNGLFTFFSILLTQTSQYYCTNISILLRKPFNIIAQTIQFNCKNLSILIAHTFLYYCANISIFLHTPFNSIAQTFILG